MLELWLQLKATLTLQVHIDILDRNVWPLVVCYVEDKNYFFMDDNAPVHKAHTVKKCKIKTK